jgi:hypothetical protein
MRPDGGSFNSEDFGPQFGDAVRKSNAFSVELTLTPEPAPNDDKVRAVCSYYLIERGDKLYYSGEGGTIELGALQPGVTSHVVVTYKPGELVYYLNGAKAFSTTRINGDLRGVRGAPMAVGNNLDNQPWRGAVEGIALYARCLSADEARAEADAYKQVRDHRPASARVEVEATLAAVSRVPKLAQIAPYRRAMMVNEYTIDKVVSGKLDAKKVRVSQWVILAQQTDDVAQLAIGEKVNLVLAPLAACKQLEGENSSDTLPEDFDAPQFFAISAHWALHSIPHWIGIASFVPPPVDPNIEHGKMAIDPGYDDAFGPEGHTGLPASYTPANGLSWKPLDADQTGLVSLFQMKVPIAGNGCGYAVAYIKSPTDRHALLHAGSVGGLKAWVNGKPATDGHFGRYPFVGYQDGPVELKAGWNELLVKSTQLYAFWGFSCEMLTPEGKCMTDLTTSTTPN